MSVDAMIVKRILARLFEAYGRKKIRPGGDPVDGLIRTILSQHTSGENSERAYDRLVKKFPAWDAVADAPAASIASAIRPGGLAQTKAPRIRAILRQIRAHRGYISLSHLRKMETREVLVELCSFHGVGLKTAACVAAFGLGRDVCPVDTHVRRVATRLGWAQKDASADRAFENLAAILPAGEACAAHLALIAHGRRICKPHPRCADCPLVDLCPFANVAGEPIPM